MKIVIILLFTGLVILATLIWGYVVWLGCREHRQRMNDLRRRKDE